MEIEEPGDEIKIIDGVRLNLSASIRARKFLSTKIDLVTSELVDGAFVTRPMTEKELREMGIRSAIPGRDTIGPVDSESD